MRPVTGSVPAARGRAAAPTGGLLLILALLGAACRTPPAPAPDIVLVLVDTLRRDHLGIYGYGRDTSPNLDALAATGRMFDNHIATASQTVPSTLSMLLGLYPAEHGFPHRSIGQFAAARPYYPDELHFLAEELRDAGYRTAAFVGNPFLQRENNFDQGFQEFAYFEDRGKAITDAAIGWLRRPREGPRFTYLHYFDVHWPYDPPPPYARRYTDDPSGPRIYTNGPVKDVDEDELERTEALYDGAIAYVDAEIGRLLAVLDRLELREDTVVVVTSDHGDEFLEHGGMGHGTTVYGELVRVPLILSYPRRVEPGRRTDDLTSHVSLAATLLELAGLPHDSFGRRTIFEPARRAFVEDGPWRGVYAAGMNLVRNRETGNSQVFRMEDELDGFPLGPGAGEKRLDLLEALSFYRGLERARQDVPQTGADGWSEEDAERLRTLGYLN